MYELHPNQIGEWKREAIANLGLVFERGRRPHKQEERHKDESARLYKHIGQLQVEVDFLKEFCDKMGLSPKTQGLCR